MIFNGSSVHFHVYYLYMMQACLLIIKFLQQSWNVMVSETENLSRILRKHSEDLMVGPLSKLTLLIRDKQQLKKTYSEQWSLLNQELCRVSTTTSLYFHLVYMKSNSTLCKQVGHIFLLASVYELHFLSTVNFWYT